MFGSWETGKGSIPVDMISEGIRDGKFNLEMVKCKWNGSEK